MSPFAFDLAILNALSMASGLDGAVTFMLWRKPELSRQVKDHFAIVCHSFWLFLILLGWRGYGEVCTLRVT